MAFAGCILRGGAAALYSLIETAKLNSLDPEAYLRDVLSRIAERPATKLSGLLPWRWKPSKPPPRPPD